MTVFALDRIELVAAKISCRTVEFNDTDRGRIPLKRLLERLAGDIAPRDDGVSPYDLLEGLLDRCIAILCLDIKDYYLPYKCFSIDCRIFSHSFLISFDERFMASIRHHKIYHFTISYACYKIQYNTNEKIVN